MRYRKRRFLISFICIFLVMAVVVVYLELRVKAVREDLTAFSAKNYGASAILNGVEETIKNAQVYYSDIAKIERDENGNVKSIITDTARLNTVSNAVNRNVDKRVSGINSFPVSFPVSSLMGDEFLSGMGPKIKFYVTMTGTASTSFRNVFDSAGINQTRHQIILDVSVEVYVIFGSKVESYIAKNNLCIAENIIVGITPEAIAQITK